MRTAKMYVLVQVDTDSEKVVAITNTSIKSAQKLLQLRGAYPDMKTAEKHITLMQAALGSMNGFIAIKEHINGV